MSFNISEKLWQSPGTLNSGVLPVRSPLNSFAGGAEALAAGKKNGPYRMPLDGPWKFGFHPCPAAVAPECFASVVIENEATLQTWHSRVLEVSRFIELTDTVHGVLNDYDLDDLLRFVKQVPTRKRTGGKRFPEIRI